MYQDNQDSLDPGEARGLRTQPDRSSGSKNLFLNFGTLQDDAIDSSDTNTHSSGDPLPADALRSKRRNPLRVQDLLRAPEAFALRLRVAESSRAAGGQSANSARLGTVRASRRAWLR